MDAIDDVSANQGEPAEAPAIHDSDGERRTVDLLFRQLDVQELHRGGEIGISFGIQDNRALNNVSCAFNVNPRTVNGQKLDPFQVPQTPEQNLKPNMVEKE